MDAYQVHFEVFVKRRVGAPWVLDLATEDRALALAAAEEMLAEERACAIKVTKETMDPETREFRTVTLMTKGAVEAPKGRKPRETPETPLCVSPQDLYSPHARDRIGRLLDGWLWRKAVTPFELLHRPDLAEALDASGIDLQGAIQKIAIPEAQARELSTHEVIRTFQRLTDRAIDRLLTDGRRHAFPDVAQDGFAQAVERLADDPDRAYLLGGGVAAHLAQAESWSAKVGLILDLADRAPVVGRPRGLALHVLEQPLTEILGFRAGLSDLLGPDLDLGGCLGALTRLAAAPEVEAVVALSPALMDELPPLSGEAARLALWLRGDAFEAVRAGLIRRILSELKGPRRLRPGHAHGEIALLRGLATVLASAAGRLIPLEDVQEAFIERSKTIVAPTFVEAYLAECAGALAEAEALVKLSENVTGSVNRRAAGRWLVALVTALRFDKDVRGGPESPTAKLAALAALQRNLRRIGLAETEEAVALARVGELGGAVEADARLCATLARADIPLLQRITLLLRLATGDAAPLGAAADRARNETVRLLKADGSRAAMAAAPAQAIERMRGLMVEAGLAA